MIKMCIRDRYSIDGTFDRNTFFVEGISGLKYRCGLSGALPLGFVESAEYPHGAISKLPSLIEKQQKAVERIESEIPILSSASVNFGSVKTMRSVRLPPMTCQGSNRNVRNFNTGLMKA